MHIHAGSSLREFTGSDDPRLVFARGSDGSVVYMPEGAAERFREATRTGELVCIVPDCANPKLKAVNRRERRHGFAHHAGAGGHAGMGIHHLQAQLLIARWLRLKYPEAVVELEETTEDGRRRADVMFTSQSGRKAAFEVQYSPITVDAWNERHQHYKALDIVDIWLWGHTSPHLRPESGSELGVLLNAVQEASTLDGAPVLWINPELGQIGTATSLRHLNNGRQFVVPARTYRGQFTSEPLDAFRLVGSGFTTDSLQALYRAREDYARLREVEVRAQAAAESKQARMRAEEEERQRAKSQRLAQIRARKAGQITRLRKERTDQWLASERRTTVLAKNGGAWPAHLSVEVDATPGIPFPHEMWQEKLFRQFIAGKAHRTGLSTPEMARSLNCSEVTTEEVHQPITQWLNALTVMGLVYKTIQPTTRHGASRTSFHVLNLASEQKRAEATQRMDDLRASIAARARAHDADDVINQVVRNARQPLAAPKPKACAICRYPLADIYEDLGYHPVCSPGHRR
ncbi:competence protein CoiA family protein [Agromyces albus]|uniref:Competence protein CoiA nuclease-like domain-containing protein n=1 Tax=Agromyces albus TaxID=205332 RepID=A0A4V1QYD6_9MICO|nr:competence protein CoiA family protein [Agromyces albus]RXZ72786.1 hypothetical protein ESP51_03020 [Agromyces albus]